MIAIPYVTGFSIREKKEEGERKIREKEKERNTKNEGERGWNVTRECIRKAGTKSGGRKNQGREEGGVIALSLLRSLRCQIAVSKVHKGGVMNNHDDGGSNEKEMLTKPEE